MKFEKCKKCFIINDNNKYLYLMRSLNRFFALLKECVQRRSKEDWRVLSVRKLDIGTQNIPSTVGTPAVMRTGCWVDWRMQSILLITVETLRRFYRSLPNPIDANLCCVYFYTNTSFKTSLKRNILVSA